MRQRFSKDAGFTMVEIIVTCVIAAAVLSLALVGYQRTISAQTERRAVNQLRTIFSANEMRHARQEAFLPGTGLGRAEINTGLELNIPDDQITYSYSVDATYDYVVTATTPSCSLRLRGTEARADLQSQPCCASGAGTCQVAPHC